MAKGIDESLTQRRIAIAVSAFGLLEVLNGIFIIICAFIMAGGFCDGLSCPFILDGIGFWLGFPLLVPGILGLVVLGTRHRRAIDIFVVANVIVLFCAIAHSILSYEDYTSFWNQHKIWYNKGYCSISGGSQCYCNDGKTERYLPYHCDLVVFGYELNWALFGSSIAAIILTLISLVLGIVARAMVKPRPRRN